MGHYASEMSSGWNESYNRGKRISRLKTKLKDLSLVHFRAGDIVLLYRLFHTVDFTKLSDEELSRLEKYPL